MNIIMLIPTIIRICYEIYKIIMELRSKGVNTAQCTVAMADARKKGDLSRLEQILAKLKKGEGCD